MSTTNSTQTFSGGQSVLTFNFRALTSFPNYIQVSVVALTGGTVTALTYGSQYTVSVNSSGVGGTVTVLPTYGSNYNYIVYRSTAILQSSSYSNYNTFPASTLENGLDQLTMIEQEQNTSKLLLLGYPIGTSTTYSTTIPTPSIGTVLGSDPTGTMFINMPPAPSGSTGPIGPSGAGITLVSSSTSDVTVVSAVSSATITSINAGTGGSNTILRLNASGNLPALNGSLLTNLPGFPYIKLSYTVVSGTISGTASSGAWNVIPLNTKDSDTGSNVVSFTSSTIVLVSGTYDVFAMTNFYETNNSQARLQNTTDSATIFTGTSGHADSGTSPNVSCSFIFGRFTIAASKNIQFQYQVQTTNNNSGFGAACSFGNEVYSLIQLYKVG